MLKSSSISSRTVWNAIVINLVMMLTLQCTPEAKEPARSLGKADISLGSAPSTLDWHLTKDLNAGLVNINIMEGMFTYDLNAKVVRLIPQLVKDFKVSDNFRQWNFCIREDILWSDGQQLNIQHFIDAWYRLLSSETGSPHAQHFFNIEGALEFNRFEKKFTAVGIKKLNKFCLEVSLTFPDPDFPHRLVAPYTYPIRKDLIAKYKSAWTSPKNWVGLGPYTLSSGNLSEKLLLKENKKYYGKNVKIKEVVLHWIDAQKTILNLFKKKEIDLMRAPRYSQVKALSLESYYKSTPSVRTTFLGFNLKRMGDRKLRKAIRNSIDREKLKKLYQDDIEVAQSLIPWNLFELKSKIDKPVSVEKVNPHFKSRKILFFSNSGSFYKSLVEQIAFSIEKNSGIDVEIKLEDSTSYFSHLLTTDDFDLFRMSYTPAVLLPISYLETFSLNAKGDYSRYDSKEYQSVLKKYRLEKEKTKKAQYLFDLESRLLLEDIVVIPLFRDKEAYLLNNKKISFEPHFSGRMEFKMFESFE